MQEFAIGPVALMNASCTRHVGDAGGIPFHKMFEGLGGFGELVTKREQLSGAFERAYKNLVLTSH